MDNEPFGFWFYEKRHRELEYKEERAMRAAIIETTRWTTFIFAFLSIVLNNYV